MAYLYEVKIKGGSTHKEFRRFYSNIAPLNPKPPDRSGISSICVVSHSQDAGTVHLLCVDGMKKHADVTVTEISAATLAQGGTHTAYIDLVNNYFLNNGDYPNI